MFLSRILFSIASIGTLVYGSCYERDIARQPTVNELARFEDYENMVRCHLLTFIPDLGGYDLEYACLLVTTALAVDGFEDHPIMDRILFFWQLQYQWDGYVGAEYSNSQYERGFLGIQSLIKTNKIPMDSIMEKAKRINKNPLFLWYRRPCNSTLNSVPRTKFFVFNSSFCKIHNLAPDCCKDLK